MFRALLCSSSGGQNCIIQHLLSSHLYVAVRCTGWERTYYKTRIYALSWSIAKIKLRCTVSKTLKNPFVTFVTIAAMLRPVTTLAYITLVTMLVMAAVVTTDFLLTVFPWLPKYTYRYGYFCVRCYQRYQYSLVTMVMRTSAHSSGHFLSCIIINLLKPTGHVMHHQFNIQQLYALPTLYLCVLYLSENKQRLVPLTA